jgi:hypothetical protein
LSWLVAVGWLRLVIDRIINRIGTVC